MPVRYQRFTYRYLQGRPRPADTAFEHLWLTSVQPSPVTGTRRPPLDVWETASAVVVKVMLPGVPEEEIKALLYEDVLVVSATRTDEAGGEERRLHRAEVHYGPLEVMVPLRWPSSPRAWTRLYRQGVLTIRLAKRRRARRQPGSASMTMAAREQAPGAGAPQELPVLPLRGTVIYPFTVAPLTIGQEREVSWWTR